MSAGTDIYYNGISLSNVSTKRFEESVVYDDTGTDVSHHRFIVRVVGYCFQHTSGVTPTMGVGTNSLARTAVQSENALRSMLMEPRRDFIMNVNGQPILSATANNGKIAPPWGDVNNGPKPAFCNVTLIAGAKLIRVEWEVEICLVECDNNQNNTGVLYNRWSMQDTFDEDFYTTRTLNGRMRVLPGLGPHNFRNFVIPALQAGFQRNSISLTATPDGLTLEYTVIDVEKYAAPPFPATSWECTHSISTADGVGVVVELNIRLTGSKNVPKRDLLQAAAMVCYSRCDFGNKARVVEGISAIDHVHTNTVEMRMAIRHLPEKSLALYSKDLKFCEVLKPEESQDYKREEWPVPKHFGTATPAGLLVAYLQSPCNGKHGVPDYGPPQDTEKKPKRGTDVKTYEAPKIDTPAVGDGVYNPRGLSNIYTHYKIDNDYLTNELKVGLPVAAASNDQNSDSMAFVTLARPCTTRVIRVEAERYGAWPDVPAATKSVNMGDGVTATLLRSTLTPKAPELSPDGTDRLYSTDATFVYGLNKPVTSLSRITAGRLPWLSESIEQTAMTQSSMVTGLT